ncbi:MAG: penicillin-binding protein 2 [Planctomycetaceae bacterium]|nr:penicillin-binding protein 2 [Planctomycetaceae bacterium]
MVWSVIGGRLVQLQWLDSERFAVRANSQRTFTEAVPARPGDIIDRHGRLLATTVTSRSLFVDPSRIEPGEDEQLVRQVAEAAGADADRLLQQIAASRDRRFLWVRRRLSPEQTAAVQALKLPRPAWGFREEYLRRYPQGRLAAQMLGFRDIDGVGRGGIEQHEDRLLRGRDGQRVLIRDARGRVIEVQTDAVRAPHHGEAVILTVDGVLQLFAERALDSLQEEWEPKSSCAIVLDPHSCEILAAASRPTLDPNNPGEAPDGAWLNRMVSILFEPGSTIKPLFVAAALDRGVLQRDDVLNCENGAWRMGRRILHDHHPMGQLSVTDVVVKSSNIGMAKIGVRLTNEGLYRTLSDLGFGRRTGLPLPGELTGTVRPLAEWTLYSTGSVPMGHEFSVTPLQLITAHAALAAGGRLLRPRLTRSEIELRRPGSPESLQDLPQEEDDGLAADNGAQVLAAIAAPVVSRQIRAETASWLVEEVMTEVVNRGTGRRAKLRDYTSFGKTGTSQKTDPETGRYTSEKLVTSYICGAPAKNPRLLVLVVADEPAANGPRGGGTVAAPTAARLLHRCLVHLRVPPDRVTADRR